MVLGTLERHLLGYTFFTDQCGVTEMTEDDDLSHLTKLVCKYCRWVWSKTGYHHNLCGDCVQEKPIKIPFAKL